MSNRMIGIVLIILGVVVVVGFRWLPMHWGLAM
jgi:hypothetical protein